MNWSFFLRLAFLVLFSLGVLQFFQEDYLFGQILIAVAIVLVMREELVNLSSLTIALLIVLFLPMTHAWLLYFFSYSFYAVTALGIVLFVLGMILNKLKQMP